ncbi:hypothetical protein ABIB57_000005 [Devosia sp. UYZn731]
MYSNADRLQYPLQPAYRSTTVTADYAEQRQSQQKPDHIAPPQSDILYRNLCLLAVCLRADWHEAEL